MKDSKKSHSSIRRFAFTVTTPTQELTPPYIEELIQPHTSYQVIPSPLTLNYDADHIIVAALPHSKNKIIDIVLPLTIIESGNEVNYLGRYLLFDQRVIGIKLSSSRKEQHYQNGEFKKWKQGKTIKYKLHHSIIEYYKSSRLPEETFPHQVLIGDFMLVMGNLKMCLLFQSEVEDLESTLFQYKRQDCEIFSIVCDIPRDHQFQHTLNPNSVKLSTKNENMFKRFAKQHYRLMVYSGVRMATTRQLFLSNSFIYHPELPEKSIEPFLFNDGASLSLLCNIDFIRKADLLQLRNQKFKQSQAKSQLFINLNLLPLKQINPGKFFKCYAYGEKQSRPLTKDLGDLMKKLKLWFIYHSDNKKKPFVLPLPLSQKMAEVVKQLQKLSSYLSISLKSLLTFYKKNKSVITSQFQQSLGLKIYQSFEQIVYRTEDILNIYTDDREHYNFLQTKTQKSNRLRLYFDYLNFKDEKQSKVITQKINKLSDFANFIIKNRIIGYHKILRQARSQNWKLNRDEQVEVISFHLKNKLRQQINNHPFYKNILNRSTAEIKDALIEAESRLINDPNMPMVAESNNSIPAQPDDHSSIASEEKDKQFWNKFKQMKKSQSKQIKRTNVQCHKCSCFYDKTYVHKCHSCRNQICYLCIFQKLQKKVETKKQFIDELKCLVCRRKCDCLKCFNREKPQQSNDAINMAKVLDISRQSSYVSQQEKIQKQRKVFLQACTACLINQRKATKIKISCSACEKQECLACVRSESRKNVNISEWQCQICKPEILTPIQQPMVDEQQEIRVEKQKNKLNRSSYNDFMKSANIELEMIEQRSKNRSESRSNSPPRKSLNKNKSNNDSNKRKSGSGSRSASPKRNQDRQNNRNQPQSKQQINTPRSASRSNSPQRNKAKPQKKASHSRSNSRSKSLPKNKPQQRKKSASNSASKSNSPPRNRNANQKKKSRSRSGSPAVNKKGSERKKSISRSNSGSRTPPKKQRKKSVSRSNSRSRSRQANKKDSNNNRSNQPQKLWNSNQNRDNKWVDQSNNDRSQGYGNRGGNRGRGNQGYNRNEQGGRGRGGYNSGGYNNNRDYSNNNNSRDYNNNNRDYNNNNNNRGYNNNRDQNSSNRDTSRNESGDNNNNQIINTNSNYESNDFDY